MSSGAAPKQGDHVFNALETAIRRPFETIGALTSAHVQGRQFMHSYLLHAFSLAVRLADTPLLAAARQLAASPGAEADVFRLLAQLAGRHAGLTRVTPALVRAIHNSNSSAFGTAAARFELALLTEVRVALESVLDGGRARPAGGGGLGSGIPFQQMLDAAYDPAAALVLITTSMECENANVQGAFQPVIFAIADALERPGNWREPYRDFRENAATATGKIIVLIGDGLLRLDFLKSPGSTFGKLIQEEIAQKWQGRPAQTEAQFGAMLHLLHMKLQQLAGRGI